MLQSAEQVTSAPSPATSLTVASDSAKPFVCPTCSSSFTRRHDLTRHNLTLHSTDRPYPCPLCSLSFALPHLLRDHSLSHQPASTATAFPCPNCPLSFSSRRSRQRHAQSHEGGRYRCGVVGCGRVTVTRYAMRAHERTHRQPGEASEVWTCGQCGKALSSERVLKGHVQRKHSQHGKQAGVRKTRRPQQQQEKEGEGTPVPRAGYRLFSGEPPVGKVRRDVCECGRTFANAANLARHQRTACPVTRVQRQREEDDELSLA